MKDDLGDRMKLYENAESERRLMPLLPAIARLDGRCFSRFTRSFARPFDQRMIDAMQALALFLAKETNARVAYTQSDEVSLLWHSTDHSSQIYFDGRIQKMCSILAAAASAEFGQIARGVGIPVNALGPLPVFDCRVWNVPTRAEAANTLLWREIDATKNSVSMACRTVYSHRDMDGKGRADQIDMLMAKGINWNDYPAPFKRGTYVQRVTTREPYTAEELEQLPPLHNARKDPSMVVERSYFRVVEMPPLGRVTNREAVLFDGAAPELAQSTISTSATP